MALSGDAALGRPQRIVPQLSLYALVSAFALAVDVAAFLLLMDALGHTAPTSGALSYSVGLLVHYLLSSRFVFVTVAGKSPVRLMVEFVVSGLVGLLLTIIVIWAGVWLIGLPALLAKAIAVVASFLAVYALRRLLVFR